MTATVEIQGESLDLLPERAIWWPGQQALIVSDLHIGKPAHFRKAGLPLPGKAFDTDLERLDRLLQRHAPEKLVITGDLFHSFFNREIELFGQWRDRYPGLPFFLIKGNHDIVSQDQLNALALSASDRLDIHPFQFQHHLPQAAESDLYAVCGHLHPGMLLRGPARQTLRVPCFWFTERYAVLPAFSLLTGLAPITPGRTDRIYLILEENRVISWLQ